MENIEQLKEAVSTTLEKRGVLARLRAELRKEVFLAIEDTEAGVHEQCKAREFVGEVSLLALGLVQDFLRHYRLEFSLDVLEKELGPFYQVKSTRTELWSQVGVSGGPPEGISLLEAICHAEMSKTPLPIDPARSTPINIPSESMLNTKDQPNLSNKRNEKTSPPTEAIVEKETSEKNLSGIEQDDPREQTQAPDQEEAADKVDFDEEVDENEEDENEEENEEDEDEEDEDEEDEDEEIWGDEGEEDMPVAEKPLEMLMELKPKPLPTVVGASGSLPPLKTKLPSLPFLESAAKNLAPFPAVGEAVGESDKAESNQEKLEDIDAQLAELSREQTLAKEAKSLLDQELTLDSDEYDIEFDEDSDVESNNPYLPKREGSNAEVLDKQEDEDEDDALFPRKLMSRDRFDHEQFSDDMTVGDDTLDTFDIVQDIDQSDTVAF